MVKFDNLPAKDVLVALDSYLMSASYVDGYVLGGLSVRVRMADNACRKFFLDDDDWLAFVKGYGISKTVYDCFSG